MVFEYDSIPDFLNAELRRRLRANPQYSLRSFAQSLKMSPGALSEILRERRGLGLKAVPRIARSIGLNESEAKHLLSLAQQSKTQLLKGQIEGTGLKGKDQGAVPEEVFSLVSEWYHFAILNLLDCEGFRWESNWISSRLGISKLQAKMAMELLLKLKLVERKGGRIQGCNSELVTSSEIPSRAIRNYHRQLLEKAIQALEDQSVEDREISGIGFAVDRAKIASMKKEIIEFQNRILTKYSTGKRTDVYFLEMALFKLTQGGEK